MPVNDSTPTTHTENQKQVGEIVVESAPQHGGAVTPRAVTIGLLCAIFLCAVTPYNDFKIAATYIAGTQFPIGSLFVLFFLSAGVNVALRRFAPRTAFRPGELFTIWTLITVASGLPSSGMMRYFLPQIVFPHYKADKTNEWESKLLADAPDWLKMTDKAAADAFFTGYPRGQEHIPWEAWAKPLFFWGILAILFLVASFAVASLLRRQWIENEKFTFPLVALPVLLSEEPERGHLVSAVMRSPLLWLGFGIVTVLHTIKGMHQLYPSIPDVIIQWNLMEYITIPPWSYIGPIEAKTYPLVIGLSYLLPAEVCFSMWFFHVFYKAEILLGAIYNWDMPGPVGGYTYKQFHGLQAFGGGIALLAWTAYTARRHLSEVFEKALGGPNAHNIDDSGELMSYRAIVLSLIVSYGGIALWLWAAQVPIFMIVISLLMLTLALVTISWVVSQAGLLFMAQPYATTDVLATTFGTAGFKIPPFYTTARWENMFIYDTREMLAPSVLLGAKGADTFRFGARKLFGAMVLTVVVSLVVSCVVSLWLPYYNGGGNSLNNPFTYNVAPSRPANFFAGAASVPYRGSPLNVLHMIGGFVGVFAVLVARAQYNFGLHPIGFLCASVYSMHQLWFSIFIGWVFKSIVQRYGGMKGYLNFLPLALGFILGDCVNAIFWIAMGYATQVGYQLLPG
ncbi:MAG: hypothetical protein OHK0029_17960 [Armatimonadaceae bacterium]